MHVFVTVTVTLGVCHCISGSIIEYHGYAHPPRNT